MTLWVFVSTKLVDDLVTSLCQLYFCGNGGLSLPRGIAFTRQRFVSRCVSLKACLEICLEGIANSSGRYHLSD